MPTCHMWPLQAFLPETKKAGDGAPALEFAENLPATASDVTDA